MILCLALEIKRLTYRINVIASQLKNFIAMATGSLSEHGRLKVSMKWTHFERQSSSKWSEFYLNIFQRSDWLNPNTTRDHYDPPRKSVKFLYNQLAVGWARLLLCISPLSMAYSEKTYTIIETITQGLRRYCRFGPPILFVHFISVCFLWNKVWSEQRFNCR